MNATLSEIKFPPHSTFALMGEEILVEDAYGNAEIIGPNSRGGYSRAVRGHVFGNYATMTDALRASAREGFAVKIHD